MMFVTEVSKMIHCAGSNGPRICRIPRGQTITVVDDLPYGVDRESNRISTEIYDEYYKPLSDGDAVKAQPKAKGKKHS